jgi:hypothetical protein
VVPKRERNIGFEPNQVQTVVSKSEITTALLPLNITQALLAISKTKNKDGCWNGTYFHTKVLRNNSSLCCLLDQDG